MTRPATRRFVTEHTLTQRLAPIVVAAVAGTQLGYAEQIANFVTTNTSAASTLAASTVTSLSVTVEGTGAPVEVEFFAPAVYHSVADTAITAYLIVNDTVGGATGAAGVASSPSATSGRLIGFNRRIVLADGVSYTFTVGLAGAVAGLTNLVASPGAPASLSVTAR